MGRSQGVAISCVTGVAGVLGGRWLAARLFHVNTLHVPASLSTFLTATGKAAALLAASHLISGRTGHPMAHR